ncbi:MAG: SMC-Scp complex subunit ScpB [Leptospirales bacterium]|nr:SMC-Scp complex subunit ScpB [Leptospirales bacterium]
MARERKRRDTVAKPADEPGFSSDIGAIEPATTAPLSPPEAGGATPLAQAADAALPEHRELSREEEEFYRGLIEAALFLAPEPLSISSLARRCNLDRVNARVLADSLADDYAERDGGVQLREIAGGYQFVTAERYSAAIKEVFKEQKRETLSRSTLETLAIISYRQPITLPEIEEIRGVNSRAMVVQLLQRKLIKPQGYRPAPGRPTLYVTTRQFLSHFALNSLGDLPTLEDVKELKFDDLD